MIQPFKFLLHFVLDDGKVRGRWKEERRPTGTGLLFDVNSCGVPVVVSAFVGVEMGD